LIAECAGESGPTDITKENMDKLWVDISKENMDKLWAFKVTNMGLEV